MPKDEWDPFHELIQLRKRFSELFERSFVGSLADEQGPQSYWSPPVDVYRDEGKVEVRAEIPGIDQKDVDIEIKGNQLLIRGTRSPSRRSGQMIFHRLERQYGPFERTIQLNEPIAVDDISASYDNGVLTVTLPLGIGPIEKKIKID